MSTGKTYVGDVGTAVRVNTEIDLSDATVTEIRVQQPDGVVVVWEWEAVEETAEEVQARYESDPDRWGPTPTAMTSVIQYIAGVGDLDNKGMHRVQAFVVFEEGVREWSGNTTAFEVSPAFG